MTTRLPRFAALRASAFGTLGLAALVAACETRMPTAPEVEAMDVAAAEIQAKKFEIISKNGVVTYFVDGKRVSAEEARAVGGDKIDRMEMVRTHAAEGAELHIATRIRDGHTATHVHGEPHTRTGDGHATVRVHTGTHKLHGEGHFTGLLFVDGVLAPSSRMQSLKPDDIASIEVIKGAAAAKLHSDPKAAQGVIRITTKAGAARQ